MKNLNKNLFNKAKKIIPGGVNSPVRAFGLVDEKFLFIKKAEGSKIYDVDEKEYIDYIMSWGALILGHSNKEVVKQVCKVIKDGTSFGLNSVLEVKLAELISQAIPSIEMVRFTTSGTEAVMSAIRLARAFTKRKKIVKFRGCYHGHYDGLLVDAGSGLATYSIATSDGILEDLIKNTIVVEYNDVETLKKIIKQNWRDIACVIIEPVAANMGVVLPEENFLDALSKLSKQYDILLIFDEVITGFRLCYGGYQNLVDIKPDITILGKIIGGGFPVGAYGGRKEIMKLISPSGNVYQAGTLAGNPVCMQAGIVTLEILKKLNPYKELEEKTKYLTTEIKKVNNGNFTINYIGSMFTIFFTNSKVKNFSDAKKSDVKNFAMFHNKLRQKSILFPPSPFESCFLSVAHTSKDIEKTIEVIKKSI